MNITRSFTQYNPKRGDVVAVLGVGALGSKTAMELACLGIKDLMAFDFDIVEEHNLGNQAYCHRHIGMPKTEAIAEMIGEKTNNNCNVSTYGKVDESTINELYAATHVFLAFDSFDARIDVLKLIESKRMVAHVFDARLGAYHGNTALLDDDVKPYREWLERMRDQRVTPEVSACGLPISLGFTSSVIAGITVANFVQHCNDQLVFNATEMNLASLIETGMDSPWEE